MLACRKGDNVDVDELMFVVTSCDVVNPLCQTPLREPTNRTFGILLRSFLHCSNRCCVGEASPESSLTQSEDERKVFRIQWIKLYKQCAISKTTQETNDFVDRDHVIKKTLTEHYDRTKVARIRHAISEGKTVSWRKYEGGKGLQYGVVEVFTHYRSNFIVSHRIEHG